MKMWINMLLHRLNVLKEVYAKAKFEIEYGFYDDDRR